MSKKLTKNEIIALGFELLDDSNIRTFVGTDMGEMSRLHKFLNAAREHLTSERLSENERTSLTQREYTIIGNNIEFSKYSLWDVGSKLRFMLDIFKALDIPVNNLSISFFENAHCDLVKNSTAATYTAEKLFEQFFKFAVLYFEAKQFFA